MLSFGLPVAFTYAQPQKVLHQTGNKGDQNTTRSTADNNQEKEEKEERGCCVLLYVQPSSIEKREQEAGKQGSTTTRILPDLEQRTTNAKNRNEKRRIVLVDMQSGEKEGSGRGAGTIKREIKQKQE